MLLNIMLFHVESKHFAAISLSGISYLFLTISPTKLILEQRAPAIVYWTVVPSCGPKMVLLQWIPESDSFLVSAGSVTGVDA